MSELLEKYTHIAGADIMNELKQLAKILNGVKILNVNSTKQGGGVAEILSMMVQLLEVLGIQASWEVIQGSTCFFECTKSFHNGLQGSRQSVMREDLLKEYERINEENSDRLRDSIEKADIVFIHDPQPAALIKFFPERKNKWIWRCHIDLSTPRRDMWKYLLKYVTKYDASVFSLANFVQPLPHPIYLIPPSIDPLSEKNRELSQEEVNQVYSQFQIDADRPLITQISRFDRFKDPVGVIQSYRLAKKYKPKLQLVLAGGGAADDPEGEEVLNQVKNIAGNDPDIHILLLPPDAHTTVNALQRASQVVLQKSLREGFGLTVTEAMWKKKPVIGGDSGGIRLQVINHHTGFLVHTPEGAALRIRYLLQNPQLVQEIGHKGHKFVHENFLITRHLRDYLALTISLLHPDGERLEIYKMGNA
jgi:trehalose synthase